ncbi:gram-negative bacterial tonB protein [bacterium BMS3Abin04]|nr:gram-negative bacterial tonB protein [bacterium BMS3Abin04]
MKRIRSLTIILILLLFSSNLSHATDNFSYNKSNEGGKYLAFAEQMPSPIGGLKAIYNKIKYPEIAQQAHVQGKVYVLAFVNKNGNVDDVKVIKGIGAGCDEQVVNAVRSSKFSPGIMKGKPVNVKMAIQFQFKM